MTEAQQLWKERRHELLPMIERYGYARAYPRNEAVFTPFENAVPEPTFTVFEFVKRQTFDFQTGTHIVEVCCGDIMIEHLHP